MCSTCNFTIKKHQGGIAYLPSKLGKPSNPYMSIYIYTYILNPIQRLCNGDGQAWVPTVPHQTVGNCQAAQGELRPKLFYLSSRRGIPAFCGAAKNFEAKWPRMRGLADPEAECFACLQQLPYSSYPGTCLLHIYLLYYRTLPILIQG